MCGPVFGGFARVRVAAPDNGQMRTAPADGASAAAAFRSRRWPVVTAVTVLIALYAGLAVAYAVGGA